MNKNIAVAALLLAASPVAALADQIAGCDAQYDAYQQLFSVELHNEHGQLTDFLNRYNEVSQDRDYHLAVGMEPWESKPLSKQDWSRRWDGDGRRCAMEVQARREELEGYIKGYELAKGLQEKLMAERIGPKTFENMLDYKLERAFPGDMGKEKFKVKDVVYVYLGDKARQELKDKKAFLAKVKSGKVTDADAADARRFAGGAITKEDVHKNFSDDKKVFKDQAKGMAANVAAALKSGKIDDAPAGLGFVTSRKPETSNNDNAPVSNNNNAPQVSANNNSAPQPPVAVQKKDPGDPMCEGTPKNPKLTRYSCIASGGRAYQVSNADLIALYATSLEKAAVLAEIDGRLNELRPNGTKRAALLGMSKQAGIPVTVSPTRVDRGHGVVAGDAEVPSPVSTVAAKPASNDEATVAPAPKTVVTKKKRARTVKVAKNSPVKLWRSAHGNHGTCADNPSDPLCLGGDKTQAQPEQPAPVPEPAPTPTPEAPAVVCRTKYSAPECL